MLEQIDRPTLLAVLLLTCMATISCSAKGESKAEVNTKLQAPKAEIKISAALLQIVRRIEAEGQNYESSGKALSAFSNAQIKVTDSGQIQCYIFLKDLTPETVLELRERGCQIETINDSAKVVQAWVPHQAFPALAKWPNILKIVPPDYAQTL